MAADKKFYVAIHNRFYLKRTFSDYFQPVALKYNHWYSLLSWKDVLMVETFLFEDIYFMPITADLPLLVVGVVVFFSIYPRP